MLARTKKLTKELVRRGVLRSLGAYIAVIWLLAQGLVDLLPAMGFPDWVIRVFLGAAVACTPLVVFLAWRYDLTRKGLLRDSFDLANEKPARAGLVAGPTRERTDRGRTGKTFARVTWLDESGVSCSREFDNAFVVGRDHHADVRFGDDRVSRQHVQVYPLGEDWYVKDLGSLNGTYQNGTRIDVKKIPASIELRLDKTGPKISIQRCVDEDTTLSAQSGS